MVSSRTVVAKFKKARGGRAAWKQIGKDWVSNVSDDKGEWTFTVKLVEFPFYRLEMKYPEDNDVFVFGGESKKFRGADAAKQEADYYITDIQKGKGFKADSRWKRV